jgi:hypothetical protein
VDEVWAEGCAGVELLDFTFSFLFIYIIIETGRQTSEGGVEKKINVVFSLTIT